MLYFIIFLAVLPSLIWLTYYLKKDDNPEPKRYIVYVFLAGILSAGVAYFLNSQIISLLSPLSDKFPQIEFLEESVILIIIFIVAAFSEELLKYLAVFFTMMRNSELDEPVDLVIYMITAALGFAALENLFYLSSNLAIEQALSVIAFRFVGATFLHALVSGILGVFLVYAYRMNSYILIVLGFILATFLHSIHNILLTNIHETEVVFVLAGFIILLAVALSLGIKRVKKMKSICFE